MISAYKLMWMMVIFDLPTKRKVDRKRAMEFRNYLLDEGFTMEQLSVYLRFVGSKEKSKAFTRRIKNHIPKRGKVNILYFTDKQLGKMEIIYHAKKKENPKKPEQLLLF